MSDLSPGKHLMLTSVGVLLPGRQRSANQYTCADTTSTSCFSFFGLWEIIPAPVRPDEIWVLLTPQARKTSWDDIQTEGSRIGVTVHPIDLTGDVDDTRDFLEQTALQIPEGCRLTLNVTEGLRHHAFLFYALALYLTAFRNVRIEGAWYCRLETNNRDDPKPVIDLKPVLDLARWFHALAVFQEQGLANPVAQLIRPHVDRLRAQAKKAGNDADIHRRASDLERYVKAFETHAFAYAAGLPLELGKASRLLADRILQFGDSESGRELPLAAMLAEIISRSAETTAFCQPMASSGIWKESVQLCEQELERQARMIDSYLARGQVSLAAGLMREWVISWLMWQRGTTRKWLGYNARKPYEQILGGLGALVKTDFSALGIHLTSEQIAFANFWNQLSDSLRNTLLHHGMRHESMEDEPRILRDVRQYWDRLKQSDFELLDIGGGYGRLLICPIGLTPGVLYSAIKQTGPDRLLVICSNESASAIDEALDKAGRELETKTLTMDNAYTGIGEFDRLMTEAAVWLFEADQIRANLTGGTTLMGVLVTRLVQRAQREYQRAVHEFVLIDPRLPEQQRTDPWQLGDIHYLGGEPPDAVDDDAAESGRDDEGNQNSEDKS